MLAGAGQTHSRLWHAMQAAMQRQQVKHAINTIEDNKEKGGLHAWLYQQSDEEISKWPAEVAAATETLLAFIRRLANPAGVVWSLP